MSQAYGYKTTQATLFEAEIISHGLHESFLIFETMNVKAHLFSPFSGRSPAGIQTFSCKQSSSHSASSGGLLNPG